MEMPLLLGNMFVRNQNARQSANLRSVYCKKKMTQFSMKVVGPKIWNMLSINCKNAKPLYTLIFPH